MTRQAWRVLAAQLTTGVGDWAMLLVLWVWVDDLTGSVSLAGTVVFVIAVPSVFAPVIGTCVDIVSKRSALIFIEILTAVSVICLIRVRGRDDVWIIFTVAVWIGIAMLASNAALLGFAQAQAMDDSGLARFNSLLVTIRQGLRLVGPPLGAALYAAIGGQGVALVDTGTCIVATVILFGLTRDRPAKTANGDGSNRPSSAGSALRGLSLIWNVTSLKVATLVVALCSVSFGLIETVFFQLTTVGLNKPASFVGVLVSVQGAGAIGAGFAAPYLMRANCAQRVLAVGCALSAAGFGAMWTGILPLVVTGVLLSGIGLSFINVPVMTILELSSPRDSIGRVSTAFDFITTVPYIMFIAVGAVLAAAGTYRLPLGIMVIVCIGAGAVALTSRAGSRGSAESAPVVSRRI